MGVTISDVARESGVSAPALSRVIHDKPRISSETRVRFQKTMDALEYYPTTLAGGLARSATRNCMRSRWVDGIIFPAKQGRPEDESLVGPGRDFIETGGRIP